MKSHELAALLLSQPDVEVVAKGEWGSEIITGTVMVKPADGNAVYTDAELQSIRDAVVEFDTKDFAGEYNTMIEDINATADPKHIKEQLEYWGSLEKYTEVFARGRVYNMEILNACDTAEYQLLLVVET